MIKKIINKIKSWFTPKEEVDPHEALYLKEKESDVPVYKMNKLLEKNIVIVI